MSIEEKLQRALHQVLVSLQPSITLDQIVIETSKDQAHGDFATNAAMKLAKLFKMTPLALAKLIAEKFKHPEVEKVEIAGPGFINFFIKSAALSSVLAVILKQGKHYGDSTLGKGKSINIEFVSANPTGSMHLGHARGAALGDSMARLYQKIGYQVTREFYVNDAGNQINRLAESIYARYLGLFNIKKDLPQDGYYGEDIKELAAQIKTTYGDKFVKEFPLDFFKQKGIEFELKKINEDLKLFRVNFDVFTFETQIRTEENIQKILKRLKDAIYVFEGGTFLKTTLFGDDKDRVIIKSDGAYTYFLPDIVYHLDKLSRGFSLLIDILGPDHHGYISRMKAAMALCGFSKDVLEIEIMQLVRLIRDGEEVKMSKRTGVGVTMRELIEEVGIDAARYFFVARSTSNPIDFDMNLALTKSNVNPVFYAQYAHARLSSLLKTGRDIPLQPLGKNLTTPEELTLMKHLAQYEDEVRVAALEREPSKLVNYIQKLATYTHSFYTICRVIDKEHLGLSGERLALVAASRIVLQNALELIGVASPESM